MQQHVRFETMYLFGVETIEFLIKGQALKKCHGFRHVAFACFEIFDHRFQEKMGVVRFIRSFGDLVFAVDHAFV